MRYYRFMLNWIDKLPLLPLAVLALLMLAAPFRPMPHVIEKLIMLKNGTLTRPIDIFDLFFHLAPTVILIVRLVRHVNR